MASESIRWEERTQLYAAYQGIEIQHSLGAGYDGSVFATSRKSAIKAFHWQVQYDKERDIYLRLRKHQITEIVRCHVPRLIGFDDQLLVVEMTIVKPPYVLDFAGAYLDQRPDFPPEVRRQWEREKRIQFGADWKYVPRIVVAFERMGIFLADLNPRNICLTGYEP